MLSNMKELRCVISAHGGFRVDDDLLRCNLTKVRSEIMVFQDLLTQLNRTRDITGRKESILTMRSSGRTTSVVGVMIDAVGCRR